MQIIERLLRRFLFSLSVATLFTAPYYKGESFPYYLAPVTIIITAMLFLLSGRLKKELATIFIKDVEADSSLWGDFERKFPRLAEFLWQLFVTFAAIICTALALDFIHIIDVNGRRLEWFIFAFLGSLIFRLFDRQSFRT